VAVGRAKVNDTIKSLDEIYGEKATETCLVAAGIKVDTRPPERANSRAV
jgi:hypothetical protein